MFTPPEQFDLRVTPQGEPEYWTEQAIRLLRPVFDPKKPTALFLAQLAQLEAKFQRFCVRHCESDQWVIGRGKAIWACSANLGYFLEATSQI